jgi:hypothetical protein
MFCAGSEIIGQAHMLVIVRTKFGTNVSHTASESKLIGKLTADIFSRIDDDGSFTPFLNTQ